MKDAGSAAQASPFQEFPSKSARATVPARATDAVSGCLFKLYLHDGPLPTICTHRLAEVADNRLAGSEERGAISRHPRIPAMTYLDIQSKLDFGQF